MSMESSATGFAAANLLCAVWAIDGGGIKGKGGLGDELAADAFHGIALEPKERTKWTERFSGWLNRSHTDERSRLFERFQTGLTQVPTEGEGAKEATPYTPPAFRNKIKDIILESVNDEPLDKIVLHIGDGLIRGCALDERGIRLLSNLQRLSENRKGQTGTTGLPSSIIEEITGIIAGASGNKAKDQRRDRDYYPYPRVVTRGETRYGALGFVSANVPTETNHRNDSSEEDDGGNLGERVRPFAALAALSHLYGGKLGWEDGTTREVEELVFSIAPNPDIKRGDLSERADGDPIRRAVPKSLKKRLGKALGRMDKDILLAHLCPDGSEGAYKKKSEAFLDGLVAAFFVPGVVIESFRRAYDETQTWRETLSQLVGMVLRWGQIWSESFSRLSEKYEMDKKAIGSALPEVVVGRATLVDGLVDKFRRYRRGGATRGIRVALVGAPGCGKRTVALNVAHRVLDERLETRFFEVPFSGTASDTLSSLTFDGDQGRISGDDRRRENILLLRELPPETLVLLTGVRADGIHVRGEESCWDYLTDVGMADLIITVNDIKEIDLAGSYEIVHVNDLDEDCLLAIYDNISKRLGNRERMRREIETWRYSAADIVAQAKIDASLTDIRRGTPLDPDSLRDESGEMTATLKAMILATLLPDRSPASIVETLLTKDAVNELVARGCLNRDAGIEGKRLRERYHAYCVAGLSPEEWGRLCDESARDIETKLSSELPTLLGTVGAGERMAFREEMSCAVRLYASLRKITEKRKDDAGWCERAIGLTDMQIRWFDVLSETRHELRARNKRLELLLKSCGQAEHERPMTEALSEAVGIAALLGRLGDYDEGIRDCSKIISIILSDSPGNTSDSDYVYRLAKDSLDADRISQSELLVLVRALRTRGYVAHDLWEEDDNKEDALGLVPAINDKKTAYKLAWKLNGRNRSAELSRTLATLAYSYHRMGCTRKALKLSAMAIDGFEGTANEVRTKVEGFRQLAEAGGRNEWLELAAALNSQGYFLSPENGTLNPDRQILMRALGLKRESLEIRERNLSSFHMDLARSYNNLAITLRDLGMLSEARQYIERAVRIRGRRMTRGGAGHTLIDQNMARIDELLARRERLDQLICSHFRGHQGTCSVYASDQEERHVISLRYTQHGTESVVADTVETSDQDEDVFESGSTIKIFIDTVLQLLISRGEIDGNQTIKYLEEDRVGGSGVLKTTDPGGSYRLDDVVTWMVTVSDNIATNMIIRLLGVDRINREIKKMGFERTELLHKLDFPARHDFGKTTAKELGRLLRGLLEGESIVSREVAEIVLGHLGKQQNSKIIAASLPPYLINTCDREKNVVTILSKSGTMNDVRADAGIVISPWGAYVVVLMAKGFPETMEYDNHPSVLALRKASAFLFTYYSALGISS